MSAVSTRRDNEHVGGLLLAWADPVADLGDLDQVGGGR
jgi:hypothetical protein